MFQEDKDMADQNEAKTKTIGFLPKEKVQTLKGWDEYVDKSSKLSILRTETQKAKNSVREALKESLNENGDIDFVAEGDRIRVFRVFRKQQEGRRTRSLDLSSSFREQQLEGRLETKGLDKTTIQAPLLSHDCESDEAEGSTPNLGPITEESPANLDPVTERLMAIMRAKMER
jgi:CRISPR/Cas system-associated protein Cas10 (large subunit of type III CRISPR-Cas system)